MTDPPEQNILALCQDLHMSFSGSFVDWTHDEIERGVAAIQRRVDAWRPAKGRWSAFDGAVYAVCCATLAEAEEWRRVYAPPVARSPAPPPEVVRNRAAMVDVCESIATSGDPIGEKEARLRGLAAATAAQEANPRLDPGVGSLRRIVLAKGGVNALPNFSGAAMREVRRIVDDRLRNLPDGARVAVRLEGDGKVAVREYGAGEDAVVPDASWTVFGRASVDDVAAAGVNEPKRPLLREPWQRTAEDDMGLRVTRPSANHVQFRVAETGTLEADWWPSTGRLKIYGLSAGAVATWTDVRDGERVLHLLRQA